MANRAGADPYNPVLDINDILPVLTQVLGAKAGAGGGGGGGLGRSNAGMPVPLGPSYLSNFKTRKGQLTAGITSLIGNTLIANRAAGNPLELPWWLGGTAQAGPEQELPAQNIDPGRQMAFRGSGAGQVNPQPPQPQAQGGGGGMGGLDIGKLLTSVIGGGGEGGGGMSGLGSILGLLA